MGQARSHMTKNNREHLKARHKRSVDNLHTQPVTTSVDFGSQTDLYINPEIRGSPRSADSTPDIVGHTSATQLKQRLLKEIYKTPWTLEGRRKLLKHIIAVYHPEWQLRHSRYRKTRKMTNRRLLKYDTFDKLSRSQSYEHLFDEQLENYDKDNYSSNNLFRSKSSENLPEDVIIVTERPQHLVGPPKPKRLAQKDRHWLDCVDEYSKTYGGAKVKTSPLNSSSSSKVITTRHITSDNPSPGKTSLKQGLIKVTPVNKLQPTRPLTKPNKTEKVTSYLTLSPQQPKRLAVNPVLPARSGKNQRITSRIYTSNMSTNPNSEQVQNDDSSTPYATIDHSMFKQQGQGSSVQHVGNDNNIDNKVIYSTVNKSGELRDKVEIEEKTVTEVADQTLFAMDKKAFALMQEAHDIADGKKKFFFDQVDKVENGSSTQNEMDMVVTDSQGHTKRLRYSDNKAPADNNESHSNSYHSVTKVTQNHVDLDAKNEVDLTPPTPPSPGSGKMSPKVSFSPSIEIIPRMGEEEAFAKSLEQQISQQRGSIEDLATAMDDQDITIEEEEEVTQHKATIEQPESVTNWSIYPHNGSISTPSVSLKSFGSQESLNSTNAIDGSDSIRDDSSSSQKYNYMEVKGSSSNVREVSRSPEPKLPPLPRVEDSKSPEPGVSPLPQSPHVHSPQRIASPSSAPIRSSPQHVEPTGQSLTVPRRDLSPVNTSWVEPSPHVSTGASTLTASTVTYNQHDSCNDNVNVHISQLSPSTANQALEATYSEVKHAKKVPIKVEVTKNKFNRSTINASVSPYNLNDVVQPKSTSVSTVRHEPVFSKPYIQNNKVDVEIKHVGSPQKVKTETVSMAVSDELELKFKKRRGADREHFNKPIETVEISSPPVQSTSTSSLSSTSGAHDKTYVTETLNKTYVAEPCVTYEFRPSVHTQTHHDDQDINVNTQHQHINSSNTEERNLHRSEIQFQPNKASIASQSRTIESIKSQKEPYRRPGEVIIETHCTSGNVKAVNESGDKLTRINPTFAVGDDEPYGIHVTDVKTERTVKEPRPPTDSPKLDQLKELHKQITLLSGGAAHAQVSSQTDPSHEARIDIQPRPLLDGHPRQHNPLVEQLEEIMAEIELKRKQRELTEQSRKRPDMAERFHIENQLKKDYGGTDSEPKKSQKLVVLRSSEDSTSDLVPAQPEGEISHDSFAEEETNVTYQSVTQQDVGQKSGKTKDMMKVTEVKVEKVYKTVEILPTGEQLDAIEGRKSTISQEMLEYVNQKQAEAAAQRRSQTSSYSESSEFNKYNGADDTTRGRTDSNHNHQEIDEDLLREILRLHKEKSSRFKPREYDEDEQSIYLSDEEPDEVEIEGVIYKRMHPDLRMLTAEELEAYVRQYMYEHTKSTSL
ncbi:unnamed protein product [Owenia fusiformis]|uniref:Uncharacterized protein n=1 Tax=Owenia fusiformis TaxID=6347 RepID=A0A8J1YB76_OWEFU|nr:unnamed protein product [Owenia fusiformis]